MLDPTKEVLDIRCGSGGFGSVQPLVVLGLFFKIFPWATASQGNEQMKVLVMQ